MTRLAAALLVLALLFAPAASATPVFDCTDPVVRRDYPAQCPALPDPLLTGGGQGGVPGSGSCGGLCGIVRGIFDSLNPF
jgi:hypothetical protein